MKRNIYENRIAPKNVQEHLLLNSHDFTNSEQVREAIEKYCDAKELQDANHGTTTFAFSVQPKKPRRDGPDQGNLSPSIGAGGAKRKGKEREKMVKENMIKVKEKENTIKVRVMVRKKEKGKTKENCTKV